MTTLARPRDDIAPNRELDRSKQIEESLEFLQQEVLKIDDPILSDIAQYVLNSEEFIESPGSSVGHHSFNGGLIVHTAEVMESAIHMAKSVYLNVDMDVLRTAIIVHDYDKTKDYGEKLADGTFATTKRYELVRHLASSYGTFIILYNMIARKYDGSNPADPLVQKSELTGEQVLNIEHCILAHHGRKEWGSPVEPKTTEAFIIHFSDMLSSRCTKDFYLREKDED